MEILAMALNSVCTKEDQCTKWKAAVVWGRGGGSYDAWQGSRASAVNRECGCGSFTTTVLCSAYISTHTHSTAPRPSYTS